jgi:dipeptidyl-peptidase-4
VSHESPWAVLSAASSNGESSWSVQNLLTKKAPWNIQLTREAPPWIPRLELDTVGERQYHAGIIRPRDFDPAKKYPVIVNVYGGPHHQMVRATPQAYFLQQWIADQGFIIAMIDGRGTPNRGRDWERAIKNDLIGPALQDQVAGLKALGAKHPEMDLSRVGIYGWSFGGYFSAMATMQRPDVFAAGCAGAPVCDWLDYDTCYTERYLGVPKGPDDEIYKKSSVLTYCKDLKRPLMIIHGTADDNVYFMHSLKMTQELFRQGKPFEFLPLAGFTHSVPDPVVTTRLYSRVAMFFKETLGEPK